MKSFFDESVNWRFPEKVPYGYFILYSIERVKRKWFLLICPDYAVLLFIDH
jgi:hypothetical protein